MAKRIQVSADDSTYYTLPGNSGELRNEAGTLDDTIFGQSYQSNEAGLINCSLSANSLYKGFAGYQVIIKKTGTPTTMTGQATTFVSGKTYQITDATRRIMDPATAVVVLDNGVDHTADVLTIDYLYGNVTFKSAYTVTGPVTVTGKYLPATEVAGARSYTLTQTAAAIDNTDIASARGNGGIATFEPGLKTASMEIGGVFKSSNAFRQALIDRTLLVLEINPGGATQSVARGFFKFASQGQQGDVGALEEENLTLNLFVPDVQLLTAPFMWNHPNTSTINLGVKLCIDAWLAGTAVYFKYLYDGTNGWKGQGVLTDLSLTGGLEAMNEFTVNIQGSGALTAVP